MDDTYIYCISYDLSKPDRTYEELYSAIKSFGTWWHQTGSVWFIKATSTDSSVIREFLKQHINKGDKLFVIRVDKNWAGSGFSKDEYDWLHKNLK